MINCITVNTDASYSHQRNAAGYAFYIICDLFKIQKGGMFKKMPKNAMEAEMMCIANALHTILVQKELPKCKIIVINSDCLFCFPLVSKKSKNAIGRAIYRILRDLRKRLGMPKFEFRHVKAHTNVQDARSFVNRWCDAEAKRWMIKSAAHPKIN